MKTRCPKCEAYCEQDAELCPSCGTVVKLDIKSKQDKAILAKDHWTFSVAIEEKEQESKSAVTSRPLRQKDLPGSGGRDDVQLQSPSGAGYAGHRDKKKKFSMTMGVAQFAKATDEKPPEPVSKPLGKGRRVPGSRKGKLGSTVMGIGTIAQELIPTKKLEARPVDQSEDDVRVTSKVAPRVDSSPKVVKFETTPSRSEQKKRNDKKSNGPATGLADNQPRHTISSNRTSARLGMGQHTSTATPFLSIALGVSSAILISMWCIPNAWSQNPVFPFALIATTHGTKLIGLLANPVFGAVLLALLIAPLKARTRARLSLPTGILALTVPLFLGTPALALDNHITLVATLAVIGASSFIMSQSRYQALGHIVLLLVPCTLFALAVFGVATGKLPAAQLAIFKAPLNIYAAMFVTAQATVTLLTLAKKER